MREISLALMNAIGLLRTDGLEAAIRVYPEYRDFLIENASKPYEELKEIVIAKLKLK